MDYAEVNQRDNVGNDKDAEDKNAKMKYDSRLRTSADRLHARVYEKYDMETRMEKSLRRGVPVTFSEELQEKYGVYPYGRREMFGTYSVLHACPEGIDRTAKWVPQSNTYVAQMERVKKGLEVNWSWQPIPLSLPVKERDHSRQFYYERELFERINAYQGIVYLYQPSNLSVWAAEKLNFKILCDEAWQDMYAETLAKMQITSHVFCKSPGDYLVYLGPHGKTEKTDFFRWCALTPNPYARAEEGKPCHVEEQEDRMIFSYQRRGRTVEGSIIYEPQWERHNPSAVDAYLHQSVQAYFLELNVMFMIPSQDMTSSPVLWLKYPPEGLENEKMVWDIDGQGTYLSRRYKAAEYAKSVGKELCPLSRIVGTAAISLTTNKVMSSYTYTYLRNVSQVPLAELGPVAKGVSLLVIHQHTDRGKPLMMLPGLFFSEAMWHERKHRLNWDGGRFFVVRNMRAAHNLQMDIFRFFYCDKWQRSPVLPHVVSEHPMPLPSQSVMHPIVERIEIGSKRMRLPQEDLLSYSIQSGWGVRFIYHMLAQYETIALAPRRSVGVAEYIKKETQLVKPWTDRTYMPQPGKLHTYVPVLWQPYLIQNGFEKEAEVLWQARTTPGKVRSTIESLAAIIHYLHLPISVGEDEEGRYYTTLSSSVKGTLDTLIYDRAKGWT